MGKEKDEKHVVWFKHAYQPMGQFGHVLAEMLTEIYHPASMAMKYGLDKCAMHLQGCTIDMYSKRPEFQSKDMKELVSEFYYNLRKASDKNLIEIGASAYSHPILPLLSDPLKYTMIKLDIETIRSNICVEPTWFWPPEGAIDEATLKILAYKFPELTIVVPDSCFEESFTDSVVEIELDGKNIKCIVYNRIQTDRIMNAYLEKRPVIIHDRDVRRLMWEPDLFVHSLKKGLNVIATDLENKAMKESLLDIGNGAKALTSPYKASIDKSAIFLTPSEALQKTQSMKGENFHEGSWSPDSSSKNPYPYWAPRGEAYQKLDTNKKISANSWLSIIKLWDETFQKIIIKVAGESPTADFSLSEWCKIVDSALEDPATRQVIVESSGALISCAPWHVLAPKIWGPSPGFSKHLMNQVIIPLTKKIINYESKVYASENETAKKMNELTWSYGNFIQNLEAE